MAQDEEKKQTRLEAPSRQTSPEALQPPRLDEEVVRWRGIPKTPQGWWTFGLTVMALLIGVALSLRFG